MNIPRTRNHQYKNCKRDHDRFAGVLMVPRALEATKGGELVTIIFALAPWLKSITIVQLQ